MTVSSDLVTAATRQLNRFAEPLQRPTPVSGSDFLSKEKSMSFVTIQPEALSAAAGNLQGIGAAVTSQNAAAASPTTGVIPAAADEVSALTAAQFAAQAQMYQAVSAQAAAIHDEFVSTLGTSAGSYAATEAANAVAAG
jgi:PE family